MRLIFRTATREDADAAGAIAYGAFKVSTERHGFPPDFPSAAVASERFGRLFSTATLHSMVAELDGRVAGSGFLWPHGDVAGIGPLTVDPRVQNDRIGRGLMASLVDRARRQGIASIRLVQTGYHMGSLALYTKLGFVVREPLVVVHGKALGLGFSGRHVRPAVEGDVDGADDLCRRVHGFARTMELRESIAQGSARVLMRDGRLCGYTTGVGFFGHSVGETTEDLMALIGAAESFSGLGFLVPSRNTDLLRWCLQHGLRLLQPMTLMSIGPYDEPNGAVMPSILY